jgi:hypothetical protein
MQEPLGQEWSDTFLERVYQETGGHPMLLQYIMHYVCSCGLAPTEQTVEQAIATFAHEQGRQFSQWWSRYCSQDARLVYARFPDDGSMITKFQLTREFGSTPANEALDILQHVGLAILDEEELASRYTGEMFRRWYREHGKNDLDDSPRHDPDIYTRLLNIEQRLGDKYLAAWRIYEVSELPNYSGAIGEMRDTLTLLLDVVAPENDVVAEDGFTFEPNRKAPTRAQRVKYAVRHSYKKEQAKEIVSDYDLLEVAWEKGEHLEEHLPKMVSKAYNRASGMTHTTALREQVYQALKQWDALLAYLLPTE